MLEALILAAAATCADSYVSVHFAVSEPGAEPWGWGPPPRITRCEDCRDVDVAIPGRTGRLRVQRSPVLKVDGREISSATIVAWTSPYDPDEIYYQLYGAGLSPQLWERLARILSENLNETIVVFHCDEVTHVGHVNSGWKDFLPLATVSSEAEAREFSARMNLNPTVVPFDRKQDEQERVEFLRAVLSEYAAAPDPRRAIEQKDPQLHRFLEGHPAYWEILDEVRKELEHR
jgi:hypothetical protein